MAKAFSSPEAVLLSKSADKIAEKWNGTSASLKTTEFVPPAAGPVARLYSMLNSLNSLEDIAGPDGCYIMLRSDQDDIPSEIKWVELTTIGTELSSYGDSFQVTFPIEFYGRTLIPPTAWYASPDGFISIDNEPNAPNIAPFSTALPSNQGCCYNRPTGLFFYEDGTRFIIQWQNYVEYLAQNEPSAFITFQAQVYGNGNIFYLYQNTACFDSVFPPVSVGVYPSRMDYLNGKPDVQTSGSCVLGVRDFPTPDTIVHMKPSPCSVARALYKK